MSGLLGQATEQPGVGPHGMNMVWNSLYVCQGVATASGKHGKARLPACRWRCTIGGNCSPSYHLLIVLCSHQMSAALTRLVSTATHSPGSCITGQPLLLGQTRGGVGDSAAGAGPGAGLLSSQVEQTFAVVSEVSQLLCDRVLFLFISPGFLRCKVHHPPKLTFPEQE